MADSVAEPGRAAYGVGYLIEAQRLKNVLRRCSLRVRGDMTLNISGLLASRKGTPDAWLFAGVFFFVAVPAAAFWCWRRKTGAELRRSASEKDDLIARRNGTEGAGPSVPEVGDKQGMGLRTEPRYRAQEVTVGRPFRGTAADKRDEIAGEVPKYSVEEPAKVIERVLENEDAEMLAPMQRASTMIPGGWEDEELSRRTTTVSSTLFDTEQDESLTMPRVTRELTMIPDSREEEGISRQTTQNTELLNLLAIRGTQSLLAGNTEKSEVTNTDTIRLDAHAAMEEAVLHTAGAADSLRLVTEIHASDTLSAVTTDEAVLPSVATSESVPAGVATSESVPTGVAASESVPTGVAASESVPVGVATSESVPTGVMTSETVPISFVTSETVSTNLPTTETVLPTNLPTTETVLPTHLPTTETVLPSNLPTTETVLPTNLPTTETVLPLNLPTTETVLPNIATSETVLPNIATSETVPTSIATGETVPPSIATSETVLPSIATRSATFSSSGGALSGPVVIDTLPTAPSKSVRPSADRTQRGATGEVIEKSAGEVKTIISGFESREGAAAADTARVPGLSIPTPSGSETTRSLEEVVAEAPEAPELRDFNDVQRIWMNRIGSQAPDKPSGM